MRVRLAGGGTNLPRHYEKFGGEVLSAAIDQCVYVIMKRHSHLFRERYSLNYSRTEQVDSIEEIENGIVRECLRLIDVDRSLYIATTADVPTSSGLGSSSSFYGRTAKCDLRP